VKKGTGKVGKNFWISEALASEFDLCVEQLGRLLPYEKVETGEVGGAALQAFILSGVEAQLESLKRYRAHPIEKVVANLRKGEPPEVDNEMLVLLEAYLRGRSAARRAKAGPRKGRRPAQ